ncbi:hypothetical protein GS922_07610 [Rhodococcus hoagii]|nr:hypothetical protein [Prescottella equi]
MQSAKQSGAVLCPRRCREQTAPVAERQPWLRFYSKPCRTGHGDLRSFLTSGERNQVFIDGGLFSMNLVHGLLARGVGTCCLNWSVDAPQDAKLRRALNLPPHEVVIMMIALGYPEIAARVTHSPKIATERVLMKASDGNALSWT